MTILFYFSTNPSIQNRRRSRERRKSQLEGKLAEDIEKAPPTYNQISENSENNYENVDYDAHSQDKASPHKSSRARRRERRTMNDSMELKSSISMLNTDETERLIRESQSDDSSASHSVQQKSPEETTASTTPTNTKPLKKTNETISKPGAVLGLKVHNCDRLRLHMELKHPLVQVSL